MAQDILPNPTPGSESHGSERGSNQRLGSVQTTGQASTDPPASPPLPIVEIYDGVHDVRGVDCIWHNMNANSTFTTFRWIPGDVDIDTMLVRVARHVQQGLYSIVSLNASKHALTVVCICERDREEFPDGWHCA